MKTSSIHRFAGRCFPAFVLLAFSVTAASSRADSPCPIMLISGSKDADGLTIAFRNRGKLPIQLLDFTCSATGATTQASPSCHTESGLFYPGNQYSVSFLFPVAKKKTLAVSVKDARLSDGSVWRTTRHEFCEPMKIAVRHSPGTR